MRNAKLVENPRDDEIDDPHRFHADISRASRAE
jgi:hypothetical protein